MVVVQDVERRIQDFVFGYCQIKLQEVQEESER